MDQVGRKRITGWEVGRYDYRRLRYSEGERWSLVYLQCEGATGGGEEERGGEEEGSGEGSLEVRFGLWIEGRERVGRTLLLLLRCLTCPTSSS